MSENGDVAYGLCIIMMCLCLTYTLKLGTLWIVIIMTTMMLLPSAN